MESTTFGDYLDITYLVYADGLKYDGFVVVNLTTNT